MYSHACTMYEVTTINCATRGTAHIFDTYHCTNMATTLHIYIPPHCCCSVYTDLKLVHTLLTHLLFDTNGYRVMRNVNK